MPPPTPLSARLAAIAELVPHGARAADVCADHGLLAIELVRSGRCPGVLVVDIAEAPLEVARRNVAEAGVGDRVEVRLGDGLDGIGTGADCVVLAGIGGRLVVELLERDPRGDRGVEALVLQPNKQVEAVREWLSAHGWRIDDERLVHEGGRFFQALRAVRGRQELDRADVLLGPVNRRRRGPVFEAFVAHTLGWMTREAEALEGAGRGEASARRVRDIDAVRRG